MKVTALFISDVHLGSKGSQAKEVLRLLKYYEPKNLFIVGDFIDGWLLKKRHYWTQDFTNVIRKILSLSKNGCKVYYITGNHDDFLREYSPTKFGNIEVVDEMVWKNFYISHGDLYDGVVKLKWLGVLGSIGYEIAIWIDTILRRFGMKRSLSSYLKKKVKGAVKFITSFERQLAYQALSNNCQGVVTGHIHTPEDKIISIKNKDIRYINTGDWIENNSFVVYNKGKWKLKTVIDKD